MRATDEEGAALFLERIANGMTVEELGDDCVPVDSGANRGIG